MNVIDAVAFICGNKVLLSYLLTYPVLPLDDHRCHDQI